MDGVRLGAVFRAVRIRSRLRQVDVATRAHVSAASVGRVERGHPETATVRTLLAIAAALDIRLDFEPRWRGGELGRLLNAAHSAMHEQVASRLARLPEWTAQPEVSFSIYGERGVVDLLAFHRPTRALLVIELKSELADVQAIIGTVDRYLRLARRIAAEREWRATSVSGWVVLRDTMTNRRRVAAHATVLRAAFPMDGPAVRQWLREPLGTVRALSFLSYRHPQNARGPSGGNLRVRVPTKQPAALRPAPPEASSQR
jgi:transcriptional regulator with XRE-family HTH domain